MFSLMFVCLHLHPGSVVPPPEGMHPTSQRTCTPSRYGQPLDGLHPTGIHPCLQWSSFKICFCTVQESFGEFGCGTVSRELGNSAFHRYKSKQWLKAPRLYLLNQIKMSLSDRNLTKLINWLKEAKKRLCWIKSTLLLIHPDRSDKFVVFFFTTFSCQVDLSFHNLLSHVKSETKF